MVSASPNALQRRGVRIQNSSTSHTHLYPPALLGFPMSALGRRWVLLLAQQKGASRSPERRAQPRSLAAAELHAASMSCANPENDSHFGWPAGGDGASSTPRHEGWDRFAKEPEGHDAARQALVIGSAAACWRARACGNRARLSRQSPPWRRSLPLRRAALFSVTIRVASAWASAPPRASLMARKDMTICAPCQAWAEVKASFIHAASMAGVNGALSSAHRTRNRRRARCRWLRGGYVSPRHALRHMRRRPSPGRRQP